MTKAELAEQLRQKIREREELSPEFLYELNEFDDDYIVDRYLNTACKDCDKKLAEGLEVEQILAESRNLDDFFDRCATANDQAHDHTVVPYEWPSEIDIEGTGGAPLNERTEA